MRQPLLSVEWWNDYFGEDGGWESNRGRVQTRAFVKAFCTRSRLDRHAPSTILDASCALGDAMPVLRRHFPNATLFGNDFSDVAVRRSRERYGTLAEFSVRAMDDIDGTYDLVYSSATLEHFIDSEQLARTLLSHSQHLAVVVPYNEQRHGQDLECFPPESDHVRTFREHSFDFLLDERLARRVEASRPFRVPGAWSWTPRQRVVQTAKNAARWALGRPLVHEKTMILFEIENATA
ncbi:MAG: class I SAM-dependent methyltransferase [Verrucomicrobia bacterium]|nr:class I SAM-dependent methyltransferase [Verrucomicrobiota bacterium]